MFYGEEGVRGDDSVSEMVYFFLMYFYQIDNGDEERKGSVYENLSFSSFLYASRILENLYNFLFPFFKKLVSCLDSRFLKNVLWGGGSSRRWQCNSKWNGRLVYFFSVYFYQIDNGDEKRKRNVYENLSSSASFFGKFVKFSFPFF